jgi:hypothetical protein
MWTGNKIWTVIFCFVKDTWVMWIKGLVLLAVLCETEILSMCETN